MLDEYALHPDPMPWWRVQGLRISLAEQHEGVVVLEEKGFVEWAGVKKDEWVDTLYRISRAGRAYWKRHVEGKRTRPGIATPLPRHSFAQLTRAIAPNSAWDLGRITWELSTSAG